MKSLPLCSCLILLVFLAACWRAIRAGDFPTRHVCYIQNKGSDTIVNLALAWAEKYQAEHPDVSISVTGGGSGTGIAALLNKTVDIANASRQMQADEIKQAKANGFDPVEFVVARDAIAVIVNPANPVSRLTFQQISDIYSRQDQQLVPGRRPGPADRAAFARGQLRNACLLPRYGHPPGRSRIIRPFLPPTRCSCLLRKALSARSARTRMPSAMMAWAMSLRT